MCGIGMLCAHLQINDPNHILKPTAPPLDRALVVRYEAIVDVITPRGPDGTCIRQVHLEKSEVVLMASLLALRGMAPRPQPITSTDGNHILCWNGEVFGNNAVFNEIYANNYNDTAYLIEHLSRCENAGQVLSFLSRIEGPFAFIYVNKTQRYILFGKDPMGRRSLLYSYRQGGHFALSSTACSLHERESQERTIWEELSVDGIYCLRFDENRCNIELYSWNYVYNSNSVIPVLCAREEHNIAPPTDDYVTNVDLYEKTLSNFMDILSNSVRKRVTKIYDQNPNNETRVATLFSGGIDSVVITALAHLALIENPSDAQQAIDLLNVSFGNDERQIKNAADRKQAIEAYRELKTLYPERLFRLVLIDISAEELSCQKAVIEHLIYPRNTVLDFSIGAALWFAACGKGYIYDSDSSMKQDYVSPARVLLCGIGSDEQLAGYGRHLTRFMRGNKKCNWHALDSELDMDVRRLWVRNLARDDRLLSSHGKESRNPFLDEDLIRFCRSQPLWHLADMRNNKQGGDKMILRDGANRMGLSITSKYVKRAIQFGSNIAKIANKKQKGDSLINITF